MKLKLKPNFLSRRIKIIRILALTLLLVALIAGVAGAFTVLDLAPKGFVYEEPKDQSPQAASLALEKAEKEIEEMKDFGFVTLFPSDALKEARQAFEDKHYNQVFQLTQLIGFIKTEKIDFYDRVKLVEIKKQALEDKGVKDVTEVSALMQQAINAFNLDQLDEAKMYLDLADQKAQELGREQARLALIAALGKNFLVRYWWQSIIALVLLITFGIFFTDKISKLILRRKIYRLELELSKTNEQIKQLQKECFIHKDISVNTYKERAAKYEDRITELKHTIPILESELKNGRLRMVWLKDKFSFLSRFSSKKRIEKKRNRAEKGKNRKKNKRR